MIKRILCVIFTVTFILTLAACGSEKADETTSSAETAVQQTDASPATKDSASQSTGSEAEKAIPGKLVIFANDSAKPITALRLTGNRAGTQEGFNAKKAGTENIRSVFELNEWIEIYPETEEETGLMAFVIPHHDDLTFYTDPLVVAETTPTADLIKPEEDGDSWGSLYVHPEEWQAGDYDLVITIDDMPLAAVMIRLYNEGELEGKSDAQLEQLMKE